MTDAHKSTVLNALQAHVGHDHGIGVRELADCCGLSERDVRSAVTALREDGIGVCATPGTGYFLAATDAELERYCLAFLRHRALHSLHLVSRLTHTALPDLLGQMRIET